MRRRFFILILLIIFISFSLTSNSKGTSQNYQIIIEDDANLLTESQKLELKSEMTALTEFGYVIFKTTNTNTGYYKPLKYIQDFYYSKYGNASGVAFYIDMKSRQICACATGGLDRVITNGKCDSIMDNVYTYASKGNYYKCAQETFSQMNLLLNGEKIAEPMKHICNVFVSIMLSQFAIYGIYSLINKNRKPSHKELIEECEVSFEHTPVSVTKTGQHKVYSPSSSDSSGIGGSSSGGGGRRWIFRKWRKPRILIQIRNTYQNI